MIKMFNYNRTEDEVFNSLVDNTLELAISRYEGKEVADYAEKNSQLLKSMGKKAVEGTRYESEFEAKGLAVFSNPNVRNNSTVRDNFNAVIAQITNAIVPIVSNDTFNRFIAEIHQVGWGETARFIIESNDLFKVNSKAEGVKKGVDQAMYNDEINVNARPIEISAHIDWYPFVSGVFDMGNFALKIGRSFMGYIFLKAVKGMLAAADDFSAAYKTNGITPVLWGTLKQRVMAANGGMNVVAIGTEVALSGVTLAGNFQVEIGEEMNKVGYLSQYLSTPLIALKNALVPGTTNEAATLVLPDDKIFFVPVAGQRPIKIVFEGNDIAVDYDPQNSGDVRYGIVITMRVGIAAVCGAKYGYINLAS